jgi:hypothetical protein
MPDLKRTRQARHSQFQFVRQADKTFEMSQQRLRGIHRELTKIKRLSVKDRKKFFKSCSKECINKICECVQNLLNANLPIKACHLKKLSRHKQSLRVFAAKRTSLAKRKRILQKGGFIGALFPAILPAVASLVGSLLSNG